MWTASVMTTNKGKLSGLDIALSISLMGSNSDASLIRVFYSAGLQARIEVILVMIYVLTWINSNFL